MTGASLGLRSSGSYGSLQSQQFQNPNQSSPPLPASCRKPSKMFNKDKERWCPWFRKCFSPNTKVGMLLLCICSGAVFFWVVSVGKGEGTPETSMKNIQFNNTLDYSGYSPVILENASTEVGLQTLRLQSPPLPLTPLAYFTGYTLPPGNPCESFTLPPPPADPKRTGPRPCPVCYLPMEQVLALMPNASSFSPILKNLAYIQEETLTKTEFGGSEFGGYPSLQQRRESYDIKESMNVHCGFVRGVKPGQGTGFDIDDPDLLEMESCQGVVVASAIFGAFDLIRQPKNISEYAKQNVCFYMFVDEDTEKFLRNSSALDDNKKSGLWRIVVVRNLPYSDPRRNGKVPKLLIHRLFPNARYSLWIDGKLELVVDPYQLLERLFITLMRHHGNLMMDLEGIGFSSRRDKMYIALTSHGDINAHFIEFLWRKNASFAISRHYKRFDVFVEAEANKAAGKYENASIDFQIDYYRKEGLTPYSSAKLPITSDVPEGCVIIREHVPISNLFTCLWFNEVDRFTSRDQISFSTVRDKIHAKTNWTISMFLDCERRNFVIQGYHRDVLESLVYPPPLPASHDGIHPPSPVLNVQQNSTEAVSTDNESTNPTKKVPIRRGRERRSRRHRKVAAGSKDITPLP